MRRREAAGLKGRTRLEASGGVSLETVRALAEAGVDGISVGALTHSAPSARHWFGRGLKAQARFKPPMSAR